MPVMRQPKQHPQDGPVQYQRGYCEFYKLKFKLTPDVLIPRPETELLVDEVVSNSSSIVNGKNQQPPNQKLTNPLTILDVGTGSGCVAVSIAKNLPQAKIIAVDISPQALEIAWHNAKLNQVTDQILLLESDLLSFVSYSNSLENHSRVQPDIIVANLPYIPTSRLLLIDPLVSEFEPRVALDGGADGFELYRRLFAQMRAVRLYPKTLVAEIDETQAELAVGEVRKYLPGVAVEVKRDLAKKDRLLIIRF